MMMRFCRAKKAKLLPSSMMNCCSCASIASSKSFLYRFLLSQENPKDKGHEKLFQGC